MSSGRGRQFEPSTRFSLGDGTTRPTSWPLRRAARRHWRAGREGCWFNAAGRYWRPHQAPVTLAPVAEQLQCGRASPKPKPPVQTSNRGRGRLRSRSAAKHRRIGHVCSRQVEPRYGLRTAVQPVEGSGDVKRQKPTDQVSHHRFVPALVGRITGGSTPEWHQRRMPAPQRPSGVPGLPCAEAGGAVGETVRARRLRVP